MDTRCRACGAGLEPEFRFCPACAAPTRSKLIEVFEGHAEVPDSAARTLRVSRYLGDAWPARHTRLSIWRNEGVAEAAISLDDDETRRLADFLARCDPPARPHGVRRWLASARRHAGVGPR